MKKFLRLNRLRVAAVLLLLLLVLASCDFTIPTVTPSTDGTTAAVTNAQPPAGSVATSEPSDRPSDESPSTQPPETEADTDGDESASETETVSCEHIPAVIPAVPPTCTEAGGSEGSVCNVCGTVFLAPEVIPATGHAYDGQQGCICTSCGDRAVCPAPLLRTTEDQTLAWGETLSLSWSLTEEPLFPVVYMVVDESADPPLALWDSWRADTAYASLCREDGAQMSLRVYACYLANGEPVAETVSQSASVSVTVASRDVLDSPAFLFGNEITTDPGKDLTVAWGAVTATGASIQYVPYLVTPDGTRFELPITAETVLTIPGELLTAEGEYILSVISRDEQETHRDSPASTLVVRVRMPESEGEQDFTDPARYASDYYYEYLATQPNGENLRRFYRLVDTAITNFHTSDSTAETVNVTGGNFLYYAAKLDFSQYGLTLEEAISVRYLYMYDHPLYYWISNVFVYSSQSLYFCVVPEYAEGDARRACNDMIYQGAEALSEGITSRDTAYEIALAFYERILALADYAYEDDGETPQDDQWAHNVMGVFDPDYRSVVCEGFAETYSLLLNFHGVENISVPGTSRGMGHLWNLVRLDDGDWYWCDITWDDPTHSPLGTDYKYFCVTDTQDMLYYYIRDGIEAGKNYTFSGSATFTEDHTVSWDPGIILDMSAAIPRRSATPYDGEELTLRETFTVDGMTYILTGYGKVQLTDVGSRASITIPETVTYKGVTYAVTSIGLVNEEGVYMTGRLIPKFATSVYVSKNVSYIWDNALNGSIVSITVDPENPYYTSENGVLKKK